MDEVDGADEVDKVAAGTAEADKVVVEVTVVGEKATGSTAWVVEIAVDVEVEVVLVESSLLST